MKTATLINCHACGSKIAEQANVCPHCGVERHSKGAYKVKLILLGAIFPPIVGIFFSLAFLISSEKGEVHPIYFLPTILLIGLFLLLKKVHKWNEENQGISPKDVIGKFTAFIVFLPTWIVFCSVMIVPLDTIYKITGFDYLFWYVLFVLLGYPLFLKFMRYI
ncbi:MAG: zinc ribbon domain-containing protein [Arcobacteraceae bacterium]